MMFNRSKKNKAKKIEAGVAVVYRLSEYGFVKTGVVEGPAKGMEPGWLVRDDATGGLYLVANGRGKIRVPDSQEDLDVYRSHVKKHAKAGRLGILPDTYADSDHGTGEIKETERKYREYAKKRPVADELDKDDVLDVRVGASNPKKKNPKKAKAGIGSMIADEVEKETE